MYQVQGQMAITKKETCYFVTFTLCDINIELIHFDPAFYEQNMLPALKNFYEKFYHPLIVKSLVKDDSDLDYCID